ncbi:MAG: response regulator transcription factor [Akkermansiaceae bacterium]|nr:response regulator transcription factor [Akkermansiaceae bacterium]
MQENTSIPVLVVDDDQKYCRLLKEYLTPFGYEVDVRHSGPAGLETAIAGNYHAVILDVMLPGMDGFEILRQLRKHSQVPVLMLTARGEETDRIVGLEIGADDYLPKTFSTRELLARLRAVTRRTHSPAASDGTDITRDIVVGDLRLNESTHVALQNESPLDLTALEFSILTSLMRARGRVKSREQILDDISDRNYDVFDRSIDVHISSLRKKLSDPAQSPRYIRTIRAVGYQLIDPDA